MCGSKATKRGKRIVWTYFTHNSHTIHTRTRPPPYTVYPNVVGHVWPGPLMHVRERSPMAGQLPRSHVCEELLAYGCAYAPNTHL